MDFSFCILFS
jgi:glutathione S-transferase